ncbi:CBS domain-containing protein, partial [Bacillus sp. JJ722]|uniref:CBS domain-containing protein n=1 Tax=Bacillus sp. JJ722 TaxID=3122973 RepID=UPI002FFFA01E
MLVADIMSTNYICCTKECTFHNVLPIFTETHSTLLPVVDDSNHLIGIITKNKIFKILTTQPSFDTTIDHYYNSNPIHLRPNDTIEHARELLLKHKIGHAPVVNEQMIPIGVLSTQQILSSYNIVLNHFESQSALLFNNLHFGLLSIDMDFQVNASNSLAHYLLNTKEKHYN